MRKPLLLSYLFLLFLTGSLNTHGQTISGLPLTTSAVCPGTVVNVPFSLAGEFSTNNTFTIQLGDGQTFASQGTSVVLGQAGSGLYVASFLLPAAVGPGTYRVRVVSSNPAVLGSHMPLLVRPQPAGPPTLAAQLIGNFTSQYTLCQNDNPLVLADLVGPIPAGYRVQYDVGAGLAPTGRQSFTSPVISTSAMNQTTYNFRYITLDSTRGCSAAARAGFVSFLNTEIKIRPNAPTVAAVGQTVCQNQAAAVLQANTTLPGAELLWYLPGSTLAVGAAPLPNTSQTGTLTYQVSQSLDRCEGPKAALTVTVLAASALPTTTRPLLELCRGAASVPLTATGTNLRWTDPTGTTATVAPTPSTLNASQSSQGDVYYVEQNVNGCPSGRLPIRVVVQGQPTLSLGGGANLVLGTELALQLRFTGAGPFRYQVMSMPTSLSLSGTATKDTTLVLLPTRSVTYQVAAVSNGCGAGLPGNPATATVVVLTPTLRTTSLQSSSTCAGGVVTATFQATGSFTAGSEFRLQYARTDPDTTKIRYLDMTSLQPAANGQLSSTMPLTATSGTYLVRVVATNPKIPILGTPSPTTLTVRGAAAAALTTQTPTLVDGEVAKLSVRFTGDGPWTITYRDSTDVLGAEQTITTNTNPYLFELRPRRTTVYRLTGLSTACTVSTGLLGRVVVVVSALLATEPLAALVSVYPVPATHTLTVQIGTALPTPATLTLLDAAGRTCLRQQTGQPQTHLPLENQPAGAYWLQIELNGQRVTRKILKN